MTDNTNDTNPFRYCGEYFDTETGFIYLRNRYYDPSLGRFISEDPIKDGMNWYVYANNNPIVFVDPSGLEIVLEGTEEEKLLAFQALQKLTDDYLFYDSECGKVGYIEVDGVRLKQNSLGTGQFLLHLY